MEFNTVHEAIKYAENNNLSNYSIHRDGDKFILTVEKGERK